MNASLLREIETKMVRYLNTEQLKQLHVVLKECLQSSDCVKHKCNDLIQLFIAAKRVEGCSNKTVKYYESTIRNAIEHIGNDITQITTDDLRMYLDEYQEKNKISKVKGNRTGACQGSKEKRWSGTEVCKSGFRWSAR